MGVFQARTRQRCDRIRESISLELDGELSRIERALVDRHLSACPECTAFAADVHAFTGALRGARLESLRRPVLLPRRTRVSLRSFQVGAVAALAVVAFGIASLSGALRDEQLGATLTPAAGPRADGGRDQLRARQLQVLAERIAQTAPRPVGTQPV